MRILIVHPGYSLPRHFNYHELIVSLLKETYSAEIDVLACDKSVKACSFRSSLGASTNDRFELIGGWRGCWRCQRKHNKRTKGFCDRSISVAKHLSKQDYLEAESVANRLCGDQDIRALLSLTAHGVNIGVDVWQSIQRYLFVGTPGEIEIQKNSIIYEFIKSGVLYAAAMSRILKDGNYDYILTNETAYMEWGIASRMALEKEVKVIHTGQDYFTEAMYKALIISLINDKDRLSEHLYMQKNYVVDKVFSKSDYINKFSDSGLVRLERRLGKPNPSSSVNAWFRPERKTVVVFAHLCWDAALTYGEMLFHSFEEWLKVTYEAAVLTTDVDWIFRVHPAEVKVDLSSEVNTLLLLQSLEQQYQPAHIRIMGGGVDVKVVDMIPYLHAGVTALGTVAFELPSYTIPCVVATKKGYAKYDFSVSENSKDGYVDILRTIVSLSQPSKYQIDLARAYADLVLSGYYLFSVESLFNEEDCNDASLDRDNLLLWSKDSDNQEHIRLSLTEKLDEYLNL